MIKLLPTFILLAFANICSGQIADDFEFIDHKVRAAIHGVSKVMGSDIIYVSHNQQSSPMTSVIKVNTLNNSVDTLLTTYWSTSRMQEHADGSFEIFITNLFDYDVGLPGFYSIESDGEQVVVDTFFSYEQVEWDNYYYANSIAKMEDGTYIFNSWNEMMSLDPEGNVDTLFPTNYYIEFHQNNEKELYAFENEVIFKVTDSFLEPILEFNTVVVDIENNGDFNDVLLTGSLERWNLDFSEKIYEWTIPEDITSFYQIEVEDLIAKGIFQQDNLIYVVDMDLEGNGPVIYEDIFVDQGIVGFHTLEDNEKLLLIGSDSIQDISYHTLFFRNIDFNDPIEYQNRDISIDSFILYQYANEDVFQYINSYGDSIFQRYLYTEMDLSFTNQSNEVVDLVNCYSTLSNQFWFYSGNDIAIEGLQLMPGESFSIRDTLVRNISAETMSYAIPGADFRFNRHPNRVLNSDFSASFEDLSFDLNLVLFPNPSSDYLNISIEKEFNSIEIYNTVGQLVFYKAYGSELNRVDISRLEVGSYFIRLRLADGYAVQQFIKE